VRRGRGGGYQYPATPPWPPGSSPVAGAAPPVRAHGYGPASRESAAPGRAGAGCDGWGTFLPRLAVRARPGCTPTALVDSQQNRCPRVFANLSHALTVDGDTAERPVTESPAPLPNLGQRPPPPTSTVPSRWRFAAGLSDPIRRQEHFLAVDPSTRPRARRIQRALAASSRQPSPRTICKTRAPLPCSGQ
jgi:hypothetical protein